MDSVFNARGTSIHRSDVVNSAADLDGCFERDECTVTGLLCLTYRVQSRSVTVISGCR
jgi:hypothetical protein